MKKLNKFLLTALVLTGITATAQVKVGDNATAPMSSGALLEMESTNKGLLISRMTTAQRTAIASPANGLQVFDTDTKSFWYFDATALPAPGAWIEGTNAANAKWVDGTNAGEIVLNNPTGLDNVKYTNSGYKAVDASIAAANIAENYDATTNSFTNPTQGIGFDNNYNFYLTKTSNIVKTNTSNAWSSIYSFGARIDATDTRVNETTLGSTSLVQVFSNNANNHNNIRGFAGYLHGGGTGKINNAIGTFGGITINKDQEVGNGYSFQGYSVINSSKSVNMFAGLQTSNVVGKNQTGLITILAGAQVNLSTSASSTTNITNVRAYDLATGFSPSWTGTITNYYDFYAPSVSNGGGTITNKYGLYIGGNDKNNYLQGRLTVGSQTQLNSSLNVASTLDVSGVSTLRNTTNVYGSLNTFRNQQVSFNGFGFGGMSFGARYDSSNFGVGAQILAVTEGVWTASDYASSLVFRTTSSNGTTPTDKMRILANGNVGIGTTTPSTKLEVSGSIKVGNDGDTATNGTIRYNSTTNKFQGYANGAWVDLH